MGEAIGITIGTTLAVVLAVCSLVWVTVLPTIGLLWSIGWIH